MLRQVRESLEMARPRSLARMHKLLEDLVEGVRALRGAAKQLNDRDKAIEQRQERDAIAVAERIKDLDGRLHSLSELVSVLELRESQLRAVVAADAALDDALFQLPSLCDETRVVTHVRNAIANAELRLDPLPHLVVSEIFPSDFYDALLRGIPPYELFADKPLNKQQLKVPLAYGPAFSRAIWKFLVEVALERGFRSAIVEKFKAPLSAWIAREWPELAADPLGPPMELHTTDGRILLRGRGYRIRPHRDPKWGFITGLLYLARRGDSEKWGTQIYSVKQDEAAGTVAPHWIDPDRCVLAADVPFRRNTALVFLNSHCAHGAFIPEDAEPADLQRYIYQFRIGPTKAAIQKLVAMMPEDQRPSWEGKVVDYLA